MEALRKTLPSLLAHNDSPEMLRAVIVALWPSIVGDQLSSRSVPTGLSEAVLSVTVPDSEWKRELEHHAAAIVYKLNKAAGRQVVNRIACRAVPKEFERSQLKAPDRMNSDSPNIDPRVISSAESIVDTELRRSFLAAATVCSNRNSTKE